MSTAVQTTKYGAFPPPATEDVTGAWTLSLDMRDRMRPPDWATIPDETAWLPPGTVGQPVFPTLPGMHAVGEVRALILGREVRIVACLTNRPGVTEVTPDVIKGMLGDTGYQDSTISWLQGA